MRMLDCLLSPLHHTSQEKRCSTDVTLEEKFLDTLQYTAHASTTGRQVEKKVISILFFSDMLVQPMRLFLIVSVRGLRC